jgi:hypothetical protein
MGDLLSGLLSLRRRGETALALTLICWADVLPLRVEAAPV